jgi:hypothetical protein
MVTGNDMVGSSASAGVLPRFAQRPAARVPGIRSKYDIGGQAPSRRDMKKRFVVED